MKSEVGNNKYPGDEYLAGMMNEFILIHLYNDNAGVAFFFKLCKESDISMTERILIIAVKMRHWIGSHYYFHLLLSSFIYYIIHSVRGLTMGMGSSFHRSQHISAVPCHIQQEKTACQARTRQTLFVSQSSLELWINLMVGLRMMKENHKVKFCLRNDNDNEKQRR